MPAPRHGRARALLAAALLASTLSAARAQGAPDVDDDYMSGQVHVSTAMIALLAAVIAVFVFIAFFTVYLRHCTGRYDADAGDRAMPNFDAFISRSRRQRRPRGLDAEVIEAFPTMKYAEAKALRVGKGGGGALECAVCLSEFEDEERLRLLPKCSHAFHPDCIGEWLASHVTCPVCRCNLDPNKKDSGSDEEQSLPSIPVASSISSETVARENDGPLPVAAVVIDVVTEEEEEERRQEALELQQIGTQRRAMRSRSRRLARSHSTGHSVAVRFDRDMERFTLRLPEHVRREMVVMSEHSLLQLRRGRRAGEGSSRGGGRSAPLGRSSRWQSLLARTFSAGKVSFFSASRTMTVSSDRVEVSSSSSSRLRGKRVAAVDAADVPSKGSDRIGGSGAGAKAGAASREVAADEEKADTQQVPT